MSNFHYFQPRIAEQYGIPAAILLENFGYWTEKNEANGRQFYDGKYWTYNSIAALTTLFPYMSGKTIRAAIKKLIDEELLVSGNYNKSTYDRTLWYALTEKGKSILQIGKIHLPEKENGSDEKGKPIPINKPIIKTNNNYNIGHFEKPSIEDIAAYCRERKNNVDAQRFIDYYTANGWKVGKNPMKDWKAAVRTWERNDKKPTTTAYQPNYEGSKDFWDD